MSVERNVSKRGIPKMGKKRQTSADLNIFPAFYDHDRYFVIVREMWQT